MFRRLVDFSGYESIGIATTVVFFIAFLAILVRVYFLRSSYTRKMEQLPLDDGSQNTDTDADEDANADKD